MSAKATPIYFSDSIQRFLGPLVPVEFTVNRHLLTYLVDQDEEVPAPIPTLALVDTGALFSAFRPGFAKPLKLRQQGRQPVLPATATKPLYFPAFYAGITMFGMVSLDLRLVEFPLSFSPDVGAIVGRDVLEHFHFEYDGSKGRFSLHFIG